MPMVWPWTCPGGGDEGHGARHDPDPNTGGLDSLSRETEEGAWRSTSPRKRDRERHRERQHCAHFALDVYNCGWSSGERHLRRLHQRGGSWTFGFRNKDPEPRQELELSSFRSYLLSGNHLQFLDLLENLVVKLLVLLYANQLQFLDLLENLVVKSSVLLDFQSHRPRQILPGKLRKREAAVQFFLTCWTSQ